MLVANRVEDVLRVLKNAEHWWRSGYYVAGFLAYEAASAFDSAMRTHTPSQQPLVWLGVFKEPKRSQSNKESGIPVPQTWTAQLDEETYYRHIETIRRAIFQGDTYQINYTLRMTAPASGSPWAFYQKLRENQQSAYCAYLDIGRRVVISASPELFFHWNRSSGQIVTRPMKGTASRGLYFAEDQELGYELWASSKNRAENVMIVDLLRSDLGRIARPGTVRVSRLFDIEPYPTVWQMTSTVVGQTRPSATLGDVFSALFPSGSVTGAPKIRSMEIIRGLEPEPRGVYCGAIGYLDPRGDAVFNVPIRTVEWDKERLRAVYGVGGGITWDSAAESEYQEVRAKSEILSHDRPRVELLETMRADSSRIWLLGLHLKRLAQSARYFGISIQWSTLRDVLLSEMACGKEGSRRLRLRVSESGEPHLESGSFRPLETRAYPVVLAQSPIDRANPYYYHKTTYRTIYPSLPEYDEDLFDSVLWNDQGEVTEFTRGNLVAEIDGRRWTPPIESGLLAGTLREDLLQRGAIRERRLSLHELPSVDKLWFINSVQGWVQVVLKEK